MTLQIWKVRVRDALVPRREPYWGPPLGEGKSLGLRKVSAAQSRWIAKLRNESGHHSKVLGNLTDGFDYDRARDAAAQWVKAYESGVTDDAYTIEQACKDYVEERRTEKGEECAHDADMRFKRTVYATEFGKKPLAKLWMADVKRWRQGEGPTKSSQNRTMTALRAALNLAVQNRRVGADRAIEWKQVKQHSHAEGRRQLFLDLDQRRRLIEGARGAVRDLIAGIALTGARPGDLRMARRSHFDSRTGTISFYAKNHQRTIPLPLVALPLFERLAKDKLPNGWLFTRDDGKPWAHSGCDELVRAAAASAGLQSGVCLYTLRHSFITQALMDGMSTLDVARITGTSLAMIEKHYGHLVMTQARERLDRVNLL